MTQLSKSYCKDGKYDKQIEGYIRTGYSDHYILTAIMQKSQGTENPTYVNYRIEMIRTLVNQHGSK